MINSVCINLTAKQESNKIFRGFSKQSETRTEQNDFFFFSIALIKKKPNFVPFLLEYEALLKFFKD